MPDGQASVAAEARLSQTVAFQAIKTFLETGAAGAFRGPIDMDTPLLGGGLDSLSILQLMIFLGEQLNVEIEEPDFVEANFATVGTLAAYVVAKRNGR
jgi:acyl carrier protein